MTLPTGSSPPQRAPMACRLLRRTRPCRRVPCCGRSGRGPTPGEQFDYQSGTLNPPEQVREARVAAHHVPGGRVFVKDRDYFCLQGTLQGCQICLIAWDYTSPPNICAPSAVFTKSAWTINLSPCSVTLPTMIASTCRSRPITLVSLSLPL